MLRLSVWGVVVFVWSISLHFQRSAGPGVHSHAPAACADSLHEMPLSLARKAGFCSIRGRHSEAAADPIQSKPGRQSQAPHHVRNVTIDPQAWRAPCEARGGAFGPGWGLPLVTCHRPRRFRRRERSNARSTCISAP